MFLKSMSCVGGGAYVYYVYDYYYRHQRFHRNLRTAMGALHTVFDYKVMYTLYPESLDEIHLRVANRLAKICAENGGLYIKLGQGVASLNHILPSQFRSAFTSLQDQAPPSPYRDIQALFREEFNGKSPLEIFSEFDEVPVACASIAQVHKARLPTGEAVAVKIQRPPIQAQMEWDLWMHQLMVYLFEKTFDLPLYWAVEFTRKTLTKEADFLNEENNMRTSKAIFSHPSTPSDLRKHVYIPEVYSQYTTRRVLTSEWIDGIKISDIERLKKENFDLRHAATIFIQCFGFQIFQTGYVHCDPHPGNIFIRRKDGTMQVVVLDHGMYIRETEEFRQQYCRLWQAMFLLDKETLKEISSSWGIQDPEFFASIQLMRPYSLDKALHLSSPFSSLTGSNSSSLSSKEILKFQKESKKRFRTLLSQSELVPRELIFLGRCLNLIRAANRDFGSPVDRIDILASCAARGGNWPLFSWIVFKTQLTFLSLYHFAKSYMDYFGVWDHETNEELDNEPFEMKLGFRLQADQPSS